MAGAYILTRMVVLLNNPEPNAKRAQKLFAALTIGATLLGMLSLVINSNRAALQLP